MSETAIFFLNVSELVGIKNIELNERLKAITKYFEEHEVKLKEFMNEELEKSKNLMLSEDDKKALKWLDNYFRQQMDGDDPDK